MEFMIKEKLSQKVDYTVEDVPLDFFFKMAELVGELEYRELCHQLHGSKSEYDQVDGAYEDGSKSYKLVLPYVVRDSLYRGIFWQVISRLNEMDLDN